MHNKIYIYWVLFVILIFNCFFPAKSQYKEIIINDTITLANYKNNINLFLLKNQTPKLAAYYKAVADYYHIKLNSDSAIKFYNLAFKEFEKIKDSLNISFCMMRIGSYIGYHGFSLNDALYWLAPAASWFERNHQYLYAAHANHDISKAYLNAGLGNQRSKYLLKAKLLNVKAKDTLLDIILLIGNGIDFRKEQKRQEAKAETEKAAQLARQSGYIFFQKIALINLADDYLFMNNLPAAKNALAQAELLNHPGQREESALFHGIYYAKTGNGTEAEKYFRYYRFMIDSAAKQKSKENYAELIIKHEKEKQKSEINALQKENKFKSELASRRKILIIVLITAIVCLFLSGWLLYRALNNKRKFQLQLIKQQEQFSLKLEEEKLKAEFNKQLTEVQITALNAQMNPHFIFNCMNSIQKYILKNEKEKAIVFLQNFSELMRNVLDNSVKTKVMLDEEVAMLEKYIKLEQQRLDNRFNYIVETDSYLQADFFEIPAMIIQPYVENAIWHGLMNLPAGVIGLLSIKFTYENQYIKCVIDDNGIGRQKAAELETQKSPKHKSYGMAISKKRLELLQSENQTIPEVVVEDLCINNLPTGTRVTIFIKA